MIRKRLSLLDPAGTKRLKTTSGRLNLLKARLRNSLEERYGSSHPPLNGDAVAEHEMTVASYNIHKCVGTDGRFDPGRIAEVIAELDADVVAIQEADKRFGRRQGLLDLAALEGTGLRLVPTSQASDGHGWHGNALLLKQGEVETMRRLALPGAEPRGAVLVDLALPFGPLRIVAAHLGLLRQVRRWQVRSILEALEDGPPRPTLLLGDLNEWRPGRRSSLHDLRPHFGHVPHALLSFPSYFPVVALDRMIGSPGLVRGLAVHDSPLAQVASDHLPLKARIDISAALKEIRAEAA